MKQSPNEELKSWQDAVWAYLVEHSDITPQGAFFVKFHTKDRAQFERHVKGRWKYDYHRTDTRTEESHKDKELRAEATRTFFASEKKRKKEKWQATREERRRIFAELKAVNDRRIQKDHQDVIPTQGYATASIKVVLLRHIRHVYSTVKNKVRALW